MVRARPWLYFVMFVAALAAVSIVKETFPDTYERGALLVTAIWILGIIVLSAITLHRHGRRTHSRGTEGFGMAALPLPRSWKQWIYDERGRDKKNSN